MAFAQAGWAVLFPVGATLRAALRFAAAAAAAAASCCAASAPHSIGSSSCHWRRLPLPSLSPHPLPRQSTVWETVIIDEAHRMKSTGSSTRAAIAAMPIRWLLLLTGAPGSRCGRSRPPAGWLPQPLLPWVVSSALSASFPWPRSPTTRLLAWHARPLATH